MKNFIRHFARVSPQLIKLTPYRTHLRVVAFAFISYTYHQSTQCIEDANIQNAKLKVAKEIVNMKQKWGTQMTTYPEVLYGVRGNRYYMEFLVDQRRCDVFTLLVSALHVYEQAQEELGFKIVDINAMQQESESTYTLTLKFEESIGNPKRKLMSKGTIYLSGEMTNDRPNFKLIFEKSDEISDHDIQAFISCYEQANKPRTYNFVRHGTSSNASTKPSKEQSAGKNSIQESLQKLESMGVTIFMPENKEHNLDWDYLAGYEKQKRDIEDTVLLALTYPDIYDQITSQTRMKNEPNRPKAVLFEGPPGTGKTTSAKIIAQQVKIPLVYMPIESIMSKWYGESEKRFSEIWENCQKLGRVIIFLDEIDAVAQSREGEMHEASRRILSTLLRKIDSFESNTNVLLICATNRKQDLDAAMLSRIDLSVKFELPDVLARQAIFQRYAKQLAQDELLDLARESSGMSGRNIADVCKDSERRWAAKIIRKEVDETLPSIKQYLEALNARVTQNLA